MKLILLLAALVLSAVSMADRPNVIVILSDDQGYGDLSPFGAPDIYTPRIQDLADQGVLLTSAYATAPVCAPSRAALMGGRYPERFGFQNNTPTDPNLLKIFGLPIDVPTLAERLKPLGYATGLIGKWHLGETQKFFPTRRGFDYFYGFLPGGSGYFPAEKGDAKLYENNHVTPFPPFLTTAFTDKAVSFIEDHTAQPFFLYVAYNAPHAPLEAPDQYLSRFPNLTGKRKTYAAMISAMDDGVGQIRGTLARVGLLRNTLIIFASDNGGVLKHGAASNGPFRGGKSELFEGGIRIPCIFSMPGTLPVRQTYSGVCSLMDLPATIMTLAGSPLTGADTDGVDLVPYLTSTLNGPPHQDLFWKYQKHGAVRDGRYKLIFNDTGDNAAGARLFDLTVDPGETTNLAKDNRDVVAAMLDKYRAWDAQNIAPRW